MRPTPEQEQAIKTRDVSVALSAGAGCGKTSVLTARFISHLEPVCGDPRLHQLIAITFTERATREMRERIRREVRRRLAESTDHAADHWLAVLRKMHTARISTIHSFCSTLLRTHAAETGLDPGFRTLDGVEASNLLLAAIDDELQIQLAERRESLLRLAADFGLGRLRAMISQLLRGREPISFSTWLARTPAELAQLWGKCHREVVLPVLIKEFRESPAWQQLHDLLAENAPDHKVMTERRTRLLAIMERFDETAALRDDLAQLVDAARVQHGGGAKAWNSAEVYEQIKTSCDQVRTAAKKLAELLDWSDAAALPAATAGLDLLQLCADVRSRYVERKRAQSVLDFDDLLVMAKDFLNNPQHADLRRRLAEHTTLLLVDEFQDTDQVQVELIKALCDGQITEGKLFVVGDLKQSIYRFRGADPGVFQQLRGEIPPAGRLPLTENFRSQPAIIDFTNALFCDEFGQAQSYERLVANRRQVTAEPAIEFLWYETQTTGESSAALRKHEADRIARRLRWLLDTQAPVVAQRNPVDNQYYPRPVEPGDIAILFRALSDVEFYEAALRRHGIPYYLVGGHAFYSQQEIFDLLNLLRAVASPADEVSLAGVLRSPFFSLNDETLFWLGQKRDGLAAALFGKDLPSQLDGEQRVLAENARAILLNLRARKDRVSVTQLINEALEQTGYDALLVAEFLGERKLANLRKLIDMARRFDQSGLFTLSDFITQLSEFVVRQPDEALAATQAETAKTVRMMTIHQAKGLEFPVVVLPDLERAHRPSTTDGVALDKRLGPLVRLPAGIAGCDSLCGFDLYAQLEAEADQAELARLLYVAVTRAADYLILSSGVKRIGVAAAPWTRLLAKRFDLTTGNLIATLPAGYAVPKVNVVVDDPPIVGEIVAQERIPNLIELVANAKKLKLKSAPQVAADFGPVPPAAHARRQYSFSRLTGALRSRDEVEYDSEMESAPATGAVDPLRFGTLVHAVLSEMGTPLDIDLPARVSHHANIHLSDTPAAALQALKLIERYVNSDRARAIAGAQQVHTELEFLCAWPPGATAAEGIYLRGFIDCLYQDQQGRWHIVDFKTNRVAPDGVAAAAAAYEMQMLVYGLAAEQVLGEPPASLILHFLEPQREYGVELNATTRRRARELVDRGIAAAQQEAAVAATGTSG